MWARIAVSIIVILLLCQAGTSQAERSEAREVIDFLEKMQRSKSIDGFPAVHGHVGSGERQIN